jgi:hypothetical protein
VRSFNKITKTSPLFIHAQGSSREEDNWKTMVNFSKGKEINFPDKDKITLITFITPGLPEILTDQLKTSNIPYVNLAANHKGKWHNYLKIKYLYNYLKTCQTEYVLELDSLDVIIMSDLSELLPRFKSLNCNILYGSTINQYPPDYLDQPINGTAWRYLNAGTLIARTDKLLDFYEKVLPLLDIDHGYYNGSEQCKLKRGRDLFHEPLGVDTNCLLFQTLCGAKYKYVNGLFTITEVIQ